LQFCRHADRPVQELGFAFHFHQSNSKHSQQ
jgi:urease beta subunit